jgi:hypothetical protein
MVTRIFIEVFDMVSFQGLTPASVQGVGEAPSAENNLDEVIKTSQSISSYLPELKLLRISRVYD